MPVAPSASTRPVFLDPSGTRWRRVRRLTVITGALATLLLAVVIVGALRTPALPAWSEGHRPPGETASPATAWNASWHRAHAVARARLFSMPPSPPRTARTGAGPSPAAPMPHAASRSPIHAGFYVNWDDAAWHSLQQHAAQLDWVVAEWAFVHADSTGHSVTLRVTDDRRVPALLATLPAARRPTLLALVSNVDSGGHTFSGAAVGARLEDPHTRARLVAQLQAMAARLSLGGFVLDLEQVPASHVHAVSLLLDDLRGVMHDRHFTIGVAVAADEDARAVRAWSQHADVVVGMLYDEHSLAGEPGPVASQPWVEQATQHLLQLVPAERLICAFGTYGYVWTDAVPVEPANAVTYAEAITAAQEHGVWPAWNTDASEPRIAWSDPDSTDHVIWYLDAATTWNAVRLGQERGVAGYALWRLGAEDPSVWQLFGRGVSPDGWRTLGRMSAGYGVVTHGDGELLRVTHRATSGTRTLRFDTTRQRITDEQVTRLPSQWTVERSGAMHPHRVALTFDDGPDAAYTPALLDTLRAHHALATFFVIGDQALTQQALLRRMLRDGHLVGSHTFTHPDLSQVSPLRTRLELDATERLMEAVTGTRSLLFRPPYFGDAEPSTIDELAPIADATDRGYLTVGVHIDSDDWRQPGTTEIVRRALAQRHRGQVVLLHDGGGDRSQTVAAVGPLIDSLRAHGDTIVPLNALVDAPRSAVLASLTSADLEPRWLALTGYTMVGALLAAVSTVLVVSVVLGVVRQLAVLLLALVHRRREGRRSSVAEVSTSTFAPSVSVVIPAYREDAVIVATILSILDQRYAGMLEVIVVDDGSPDDTYAVARNRFAADPRVRVLTQANAGKAAALNAGIAVAAGEIIVALDADTVFAPDAITRLVRPMEDPAVGAVAGNAKVGNRLNLVTRWQALEYVTSQNLDRRAFDLVNGITVVPGAIGAWRTTAVRAAGGFRHDTLAEDQDLTITLRREGWTVRYVSDAVAFTEAPATLSALARQRFRWSFGTLQCAWKHRDALLRARYGALGLVSLPNTWVFQLLLAALSPIADLLFVISLVLIAWTASVHGFTYARPDLQHVVMWYAVLSAVELFTAFVAVRLERGEERSLAWLALPQRFVYRQLMYLVVVRSFAAALRGHVVGWGTQARRGTVAVRLAAGVLVGSLVLPVQSARAQETLPALLEPDAACQASLRKLPITEVPATGQPTAENAQTLVLFWSGDGGWQELVAQVARTMAGTGIPVIGVNSRSWMNQADQSPATLRRDSECLLRTYLARWHRSRVLLLGFSRGAGFSAVLYESLSPDLHPRVHGMALLGVEHNASFEFHLMDLVRSTSRPTDIPILPYVRRIATIPVVCVYGTDEDDTICPALSGPGIHVLRRDGGHHFDGDYPALAREILARIPPPA